MNCIQQTKYESKEIKILLLFNRVFKLRIIILFILIRNINYKFKEDKTLVGINMWSLVYSYLTVKNKNIGLC